MKTTKVAILEDDQAQVSTLKIWLKSRDYEVMHEADGNQFLDRIKNYSADIIVLDWEVPGRNGFDVLQKLRNELHYDGPIIFSTARTSEEDIVKGLNGGADDYLLKPLREAEFIARVAALLRRTGDAETDITLGSITLNLQSRTAFLSGVPVELTPTEFDLAVFMCSNVDKLLSREMLLQHVWGTNAELETRTVDVYVSRIRKSLNIQPNAGYCIRTVYRHGYRLESL